MQRLIECVPNISEGRRPEIINAVTAVIETVEGCRLLDVDPGKSTNRTVITFVGPPETIGEAAFLVIKKAAELKLNITHDMHNDYCAARGSVLGAEYALKEMTK